MSATDETYIWISRWERFQHYTPRRDRGPAWIKDYTAQLDDADYLRLSDRQRALLRDLRDIFAMFRARLPHDRRLIATQRNAQTRRDDLEALNHAGFITILSRDALEQRLEKFYSQPRPSSRAEVEEELEEEDPKAVAVDAADPDWHYPHEPDVDPDGNGPGLTLDQITPELRSI